MCANELALPSTSLTLHWLKGNAPSRKGLIVEDDPFSQKLLRKILGENLDRFNFSIAANYDQALHYVERADSLDIMILDIFLGTGKTGIDLYKLARQKWPHIPIIIISALDERRFLDLLGDTNEEPPPFLQKPVHPGLCALLVESELRKAGYYE